MQKKKLIDFGIIICAFLLASCFPFSYFIKDETILYICFISLQIVFFVFFFVFLNSNNNLKMEKGQFSVKYFLLFIPMILAIGSNFFYLLFVQKDAHFIYDSLFPFKLVLAFLISINEELIFRKLLLSNLEGKNKIYNILLASSVFAIFHISNFLSTFNPYDLIKILYSFGIGILLGLIYEYCGNIIVCIGFHFAFNSVNDHLFYMMNIGISNYGVYFLVNIMIAVVLAIYLLLIYFFVIKKEKFVSKDK